MGFIIQSSRVVRAEHNDLSGSLFGLHAFAAQRTAATNKTKAGHPGAKVEPLEAVGKLVDRQPLAGSLLKLFKTAQEAVEAVVRSR